jgi:hypothetical protein
MNSSTCSLLNIPTAKTPCGSETRPSSGSQTQGLRRGSICGSPRLCGYADTILGSRKTSGISHHRRAVKDEAFGDFGYYGFADRQGRPSSVSRMYAAERSGRFPGSQRVRRKLNPARSHHAASAEGVLNKGGESTNDLLQR